MVDPQPLSDPRVLRAIAHPVRNRILDELGASGPTRAADIARELGIPANQASFHLRQLAKYGLVEEAPEEARDKRDRVWRRRRGGGLPGRAEQAGGGARRAGGRRGVPLQQARLAARGGRPVLRHEPEGGSRGLQPPPTTRSSSPTPRPTSCARRSTTSSSRGPTAPGVATRSAGPTCSCRWCSPTPTSRPTPRPSPPGDGPEPPRRAGSRGGGRRVGRPGRVCRRAVRQGGRRAQRTRADHLRRRPEPVGRPPRPRGRRPGAGDRPPRRVLEGAVRRRLRRPARRGPGGARLDGGQRGVPPGR